MRIRTKLVLTFAPLALITLFLLGALAYFSARNTLTEQLLNNLASVAAVQERQIDSILAQNLERLALVVSRTQLRLSLQQYHAERERSVHQEKMNRILRDAADTVSAFHRLFIQTLDGRVVASSDAALIGQTFADASHFLEGQLEARVDLFYRNSDGQLRVYFAGPLYLHDTLLGVLVIDADVDNIVASTTDYHGLGSTGETILVRRISDGGAMFITPARFAPHAALQLVIPAQEENSPFTQSLQGRERLFERATGYLGQDVIAATRYLDRFGWGLVVQMRRSEAFQPIDRLRNVLFILISLFSATVLLASLYIARSISQPVSRLTQVAGKISRGDLSQRALVTSGDEVGALAGAFNRMTEHLVDDINELRRAEEKFQALLESAPDAIVIIERNGEICLANYQASVLFGYEPGELLGQPIELLIPERHRQVHTSQRDDFFANPRHRPMGGDLELYCVRKDGAEVPVEISLAPIETRDGLMVASAIRDITERKEAEARLLRQANFDTLTGLPNRLLAADRLSRALVRAARTGREVAVLFLDIDRFKNVNDTLGHAVGDELLTMLAGRLSECVRAGDTVARLGGDEFLIILPDLNQLSDAEIVAEKILDALGSPCIIGDRELFVGASIGITGYPADSENPDILLRNADAAMYRAKEAGRNTYRFFTPEMNIQLRNRLEMESHLRYAIRDAELAIVYQPQVDIHSGRIVAAEALLRWENPSLGAVSPAEFIPLAEETGLINPIGEWVLLQACKAAQGWPGGEDGPVRVAVNVSAIQFRGGGLVEVVSRVLLESGLPACSLELEITERVLLEDVANTSRVLHDLKQMGVRLALDDFGKGYSSLSYLKRFPFDTLKIDRSFIAGVTTNPGDAALCKAITAMANSLNLSVIGEGVETPEQWEFLSAHGADVIQGYYVCKPVDEPGLVEYMATATRQRPPGVKGTERG
jgi:diguanylate cyclase (GGDEF)-like protein/PAS domain S-box-containing protein